jgi:hypothetical protein
MSDFVIEPEYEDDDDELDECCFPARCLMPGYHLRSECHTAEMLEEYAVDCDMLCSRRADA